MSSSFSIPSSLPEDVQQILRRFVAQAMKAGKDYIEGVILYGSAVRGEYAPGRSNLNLLLYLTSAPLDFLQRCGSYQREWHKHGIVTPLMLTVQQLAQSASLFPLEYLEMKDHHALLAGRDPFPELRIDDRNLALMCERELQANLIRVRQHFVEGWGRPEAIDALLPISLTALLACLRGLFQVLKLSHTGTDEALLLRLKDSLQVDATAFVEVLHLKKGLTTTGKIELPRLYDRYMQALEMLITRWLEYKSRGC